LFAVPMLARATRQHRTSNYEPRTPNTEPGTEHEHELGSKNSEAGTTGSIWV
jgi:hypothetical protein